MHSSVDRTPAVIGHWLIVGPDVPEQLETLARRPGNALRITHTPSITEALERLDRLEPQAILLIGPRPIPELLEALELLSARARRPPCLVLTHPVSHDLEVTLLRAGADELLDRDALAPERIAVALDRAGARRSWSLREQSRSAMYQVLVERDADVVVAFDTGLRILFASAGTERMLGYAVKEILGRTITEFLAPASVEDALGFITDAVARPGEHVTGRVSIRHREGQVLRVEGTVTNLLADPSVHALVAAFRDVTARPQAEDLMAERERRFRELADAAPVPIWIEDPARNLVWENSQALAFVGRSWREEMGRGWLDTVHPDDQERVRAHYSSTTTEQRGFTFEFRMRRADGAWRHLLQIAIPRWDDTGAFLGFLGVDVDVTDLKEATRRIGEAEARYRAFIEQSTEGIWRFEMDDPMPLTLPEEAQVDYFLDRSRLAECNVAMARMYGYETPEELQGRPLRAFADPKELEGFRTFLRRFIRSGYRLSDAESRELDRHGRVRHFRNNLVASIESGRVVRSWGTQRDVTEQRALEEEARQARKMETAGRLAGGIAHDFNNLLTAILGTAEILLGDLPPGSTAYADIEEIKRAATRAANLTRQLLAFSRRQVLQPRVLDLNSLVSGIERMLTRLIGEHIELAALPASALWPVRADPGQLEQVLVNLCVNARDAMPTGGRLTIETANLSFRGAGHGPESVMPAGDYVLLTVRDTGTGMDDETLRHLFEPFFTTKAPGKGTGLGLATVYGIVKQSGGFIYADSAPGQGSVFRVYLPRVLGAVDAPDPLANVPLTGRGEGTLLLVEDEEGVRRLARRVLEAVGYRVFEAPNGDEALRLARQWSGPLDLVVTDVIMPGMSGQELSVRLRELRPGLRILYVSGYTDDAILQHGNLLPNTAFLQKPFSPASLVARVRDVLAR